MKPEPASDRSAAGTGAPSGYGPFLSHSSDPSSSGDLPEWRVAGGAVDITAPVVMGILNLTPDSFSDGGRLGSVEEAVQVACAMVQDGADILDVGGESTRPGAGPVPVDEELRRVLPFVETVTRELSVPVSVDTRNAPVARACLDAGAAVVNDVSGLTHDREMAALVADRGAGVVLMHMRGDPATMREMATYQDVAAEVAAELEATVARARAAGVRDDCIVVDPGIGFAKTGAQSFQLLGHLDTVVRLGFPVLVGPSRKSFLGEVLNVPPEGRVAGTVAACVGSYFQGACIFRVHDVEPVAQALAVARAMWSARRGVERGGSA